MTCKYLQRVKIMIGQLMSAKREPLAPCRLGLTAGAARRRDLRGGELGGKHKSWCSNCCMQMQGAERRWFIALRGVILGSAAESVYLLNVEQLWPFV